MKHNKIVPVIPGLIAFILTISVYFFIMKHFTDTYDVNENKPVFKEHYNVVMPRFIWDPASGSWHTEAGRPIRGKEQLLIDIRLATADHDQTKKK